MPLAFTLSFLPILHVQIFITIYIRPASPTPTYYSVDDSEPPSPTDDTPSQPTLLRPSSQIVIDECVTRISESLRNPRALRRLGGGESGYFWALCLPAGTADILDEHINEIRNRIFGACDCNLARFGIIFKGHKLVELWCRPVHSRKHGTHVDPLDEDYLVIHVFRK